LSHELAIKLSPIQVSIQLAKKFCSRRRASIRTPRQPIEVIERQIRHQGVLVNDILEASAFARVLRLRREVLDLRDAIQHANRNLQSDLCAKPLTLKLDLPDISCRCLPTTRTRQVS